MRKKKILVIDDDPSVGTMIAETLGPDDCDVLSVADPMRGIEKAREAEPDLVFLSLIFPDFNGLRVSKTLHSDERLKGVPIVMLISYQGELDPKYTTAIGVVDVLVKPFTPGDIVSMTNKILGRYGFSPGAEETVSGGPAGQESEISSLDEEWFFEPAPEFVQGTDKSLEPDEVTIGKRDDFPAAKESRKKEESGEDESFFDAEPKKDPIRKIAVITASVLVMTVLGIGALQIRKYFYPDSTKKIPSPAAKASQVRGPVKEHAHNEGTVSPGEEMKSAMGEKGKDEFTYSVQLGVFSNAQNALSLVKRMKEKGYDAFIEGDGSGKRSRVLIGRFDDKKKALEQSLLILRKDGIKTIIYRR